MQNVQPVDPRPRRGRCTRPGPSRIFEQRLATSFAELLRVVQAEDWAARVENHRGGDHRTAQRTATDLVDARDQILHQIEIQAQLHQRRSTQDGFRRLCRSILAQGPMDGIEEFHLLRAVVQQRRGLRPALAGGGVLDQFRHQQAPGQQVGREMGGLFTRRLRIRYVSPATR